MTAPCAAPRRRRPRRRPLHRRPQPAPTRNAAPAAAAAAPRRGRRGRPDHARNPNAPCASRPLPPHRRAGRRAEQPSAEPQIVPLVIVGLARHCPGREANLHRRGRLDLGADRQPTPHRHAGPAVRRRAQAGRHGQLLPRAERTGPRHPRASGDASDSPLSVQVLLEPPGLDEVAVIAIGIAARLLADVDAVVAGRAAATNERLRVVRIVDRHDPIHRQPVVGELVALDDARALALHR